MIPQLRDFYKGCDAKMPKKKLTVDRFEEDFAVLIDADGNVSNLPRENVPDETHEGDIVELDEADGNVQILRAETEKRAERINSLFDKIKNRSDKQ